MDIESECHISFPVRLWGRGASRLAGICSHLRRGHYSIFKSCPVRRHVEPSSRNRLRHRQFCHPRTVSTSVFRKICAEDPQALSALRLDGDCLRPEMPPLSAPAKAAKDPIRSPAMPLSTIILVLSLHLDYPTMVLESRIKMEHHDAVAAFSALGHEHRLAIYRLLVEAGPEGLSAGVIADRLCIPPSSLTFHTQALVRAGVVTQRRESRLLFYTADFETMNALAGYITENCCAGGAGRCGSASKSENPIAQPLSKNRSRA